MLGALSDSALQKRTIDLHGLLFADALAYLKEELQWREHGMTSDSVFSRPPIIAFYAQ